MKILMLSCLSIFQYVIVIAVVCCLIFATRKLAINGVFIFKILFAAIVVMMIVVVNWSDDLVDSCRESSIGLIFSYSMIGYFIFLLLRKIFIIFLFGKEHETGK